MNVWVAALRRSLTSRLFLILAGLTAVYIAAGYVVADIYHWPVNIHTQLYSNVIKFGTMWFVLGLVAWRSFYIMIVQRPDRLTITIWRDLRDHYLTPDRLMGGVPVIILFVMMLSVFTSFKSMLPEIQPFAYDEVFSRIDRAIHFGTDPWRILFPVMKFAIVTTFISFIYKTWFVAKFCVLYWQAFATKRPGLREQFFLTYMLSWIINGTILATLFSSAGPCFYGLATGLPVDPYVDLIKFLHDTNEILPVWDLFAQDYLWRVYKDEGITLFSGISAMPSMHISMAFLFVLVGFGTGRKIGIFFTIYLILMMIGSVHLGWHYAIDGYFAIVTTWLIWVICGWFIRYASKGVATDHDQEANCGSSG